MPLKPDGSACDSGAGPSSLVGMASAQCGGASQSRCPQPLGQLLLQAGGKIIKLFFFVTYVGANQT